MKQEVINPPASVGFGVRHGQVLLQFLFYIILYSIEMSLSITITDIIRLPKFTDVSSNTIAVLFQSYMVGFLITVVPGGFICKRYGFKWPMVIFMSITSAVTFNVPTLTNAYGLNGLKVCRIIQGLCLGLLFPMPAEAISRWVPVKERTILGTAVYASGILGIALSLFGGVILANTNLDWSFTYIQLGFLSIIWVVLMAVFGADSPEQYPRKISDSELEYIIYNRGHVIIKEKVKTPWRQILTSMPFWAIVVTQIGVSWMFYVMATNLPIYINFKFDYNINYKLFALIDLITWLLSLPISGIAQLQINKGTTTIGQSRKLYNTLGTFIPAFCFIILMFDFLTKEYVDIAIWVIMSTASIGTICGSKLNCNDITNNFAPIVYGTASWIAMVSVLVNVLFVNMRSLDDWTFIFGYTAILLIVTNLFYLKFGSSEEQEWSIYEDQEDEEIDLSKSTSRASVDEGKYLLYVKKQ